MPKKKGHRKGVRPKPSQQSIAAKVRFGIALDAQELVCRICLRLSKHSRLQFRKGKDYNETYLRLPMQEFNHLRNKHRDSELDDYYRDEVIQEGLGERIVVGIGRNIVIVTHDD